MRSFALAARASTPWAVVFGAATSIRVSIDPNGNLTSDGTKTYQWDAENRLVAVLQGATSLASFVYDGNGKRASKTAGAVTHTYVYDQANVVEERTSGGQILDYVHVALDRPLAQRDQAGVVSYYVADHLGSIAQATSATGTVTLTREYDPWGNPAQGASTVGYAFTGREWDPETQLYYYRARYYAPTMGRLLSEDAIGFASGSNFYSYVGNGPIARSDPSGLVIVNRGPTTMHMEESNVVVPHCTGHLGCTDTNGGIDHNCSQDGACWKTEFTVTMSIDIWVSSDLGFKTPIVDAHERGHAAISEAWFDQVVADARTMEGYRFRTKRECDWKSVLFEFAWIEKLNLRQFFYQVF